MLTVLVSPTARILDVLRVVQQGDAILVLTLPWHGSATLSYLQRRIFFMDKVSLTDASPKVCQFDLEGPQAEQALGRLGFDTTPGIDEVALMDFNGKPLRAIGQRGLAGAGFRLLADAPSQAELKAGLPAAGAELSEEYTPLQVGMEHAVSGSKGCYPRQEVIARQVTYDKVTRHLVGLKLEQPVTAGTPLLAEGTPVGVVTSAVVSPRFGAVALGVVKRPHHEAGTPLEVDGAGSAGVVGMPMAE